MPAAPSSRPAPTGRRARAFAWTVVRLRYLLLPAWIAAALAVTFGLAGLGSGEPLALGGLIPQDAPALEVSQRERAAFSAPLTADTVVVQRNPDGLSPETQARGVARAVAATRAGGGPESIALALPVPNTLGLVPASRESGTTLVTYLFFTPDSSLTDQVRLADRYAAQIGPQDHLVGVTGPAPARWKQYDEISDHLALVESGTVVLIALVVGLTFRSLGAPLLTLFASGIAFLLSRGLIPWVADRLDAAVPQEVEPLVVALTLGVVTDYTVFFLSAGRRRLAAGETRVVAAEQAAASVAPIVATAGLIVVAGTAALLAGELEFFRAFGPALALTAAVALVVSLTLVPACLAIFGRALFWPRLTPGEEQPEPEERPSRLRRAATRFALSLPVATFVALVVVAGLVAAATGLRETNLAFRLITGLPSDTEEQQAANAAARGFAPGILAPTVVLVEGPGVAGREDAIARLEREIGDLPGIAAVIGPAEAPTEAPEDAFLARNGGAARLAVVLEDSPLGAPAIDALTDLRDRLPDLVRRAGLGDAEAGVTGQTALAADTVDAVISSSLRVGAVVIAVNFVLLALFLRAVVAPLYLLLASLLSVGATLGLTTYFFQDVLGHTDLTYYVPFAAGVLLISLGSDYNVFVVGRIWQEARRRRLRDAIAVAAPRASRAISVAGVALAFSFAVLAVIPLDAFREFAFMMAVGILLETFIVRSLLIPSLVSVFGRRSAWPGRLLRREEEAAAAAEIGDERAPA
jgi:putative drug exporter of the RND superfamily